MTSVLFTVSSCASFAHQRLVNAQLRVDILDALCSYCCSLDGVLFHRCPAQCFDRFEICQSNVCRKLERPLQSLCSPVNVGTLQIVRVATSGVTFGAAEVSYLTALVLSVSSVPSVPPRLLASEFLPWLMSQEYCSSIGFVSRCGFVTRGSATTCEVFFLLASHCTTKQLVPPVSTCTTTRSQAPQEESAMYCRCVHANFFNATRDKPGSK